MNNELEHHGIKGMRWGVRRFQNKDGSLKNAGKKRYNVDIEDAVTKKQKAKASARKASAQYNRTYSEKSLPRPSHEAGIFYRSWYFRPSNSSGTESFFIPNIFWFLWFPYFTAI